MALAVLTLDALTGFRLGLVRLGLSGLDGPDLSGPDLVGLGHGGLGVPRWPWPWCAPVALFVLCFGLGWP